MTSKIPKRPDLLAQWSRASIPTEWSATPADRRARLVSAIATRMEQAPSPRPIARPWVWVAAVAGVALLAGLGALEWRPRASIEPMAGHLTAVFGPPSRVTHGRVATFVGPARGTQPVAFDSLLDTARDSASRLELASGVQIAVGSGTQIVLPRAQDRMSGREELGLQSGSIYVDVPKLQPGHFFAVRTPDTQITVHGTSFSVEVSLPLTDPVSTTVTVTEGVVTVQRLGEPEVFLTAGTRWVSTVEAPARSTAPSTSLERHAAAAVRGASLDVSGPPPSVGGSAAHRVSLARQTALAEQNRVFVEALTARKRGNDAEAIQALEDFIGRYPAGPLAEDAHVELFRAFVDMGDRASAARVARQYLALYGDGFARDEARELALEPAAAPVP